MDKRKTDNDTPMPDYKKCKLDNDNDNDAIKTIELPIENKKRKTDNDVIDVKKEKLYIKSDIRNPLLQNLYRKGIINRFNKITDFCLCF